MSRYPYIDRNPCILAAGKPIGDVYANAKELFQEIKLQDKVDAVKRQFDHIDTQNYAPYWFKRPDLNTSGAFTEIRHCIRRPEPTPFQELNEEIQNTIYDSFWNKPVGKSRDQTPGLPRGMNPLNVTFGVKTTLSEPAGGIINPRLPAEQVQAEERYYHDLYAFSHQNHYPGEQIRQNYSPPFNEYNIFGKPSKKDESGPGVKRCLTWFNNDPLSNVSRRQAAVRNRTLPPLGKALDKTGVTDLFPEDYTFGKPTPADFHGVEDLLNECPPSMVRREMLTYLACANKLRQYIYKKISTGEMTLEDLHEEISSLNKGKEDENPDCTVHFDCIDRILKKRRIFLERSRLEPLLVMLGLLRENGEIRVRDFIKFIDKDARFPEIKKEFFILPKEFQNCKDQSKCKCKKNINRILEMPPAGLPTIRMDKRHPVYEEVVLNMDHLGQETTARTLVSPSIYTQYGLSHRDFFKPRSKEFLANLFRKIKVTLPSEDLDEIYQEGYELDKTGGVCVETFRNLLDQRAYNVYNRL